jgi:uncharacterized membrane protein
MIEGHREKLTNEELTDKLVYITRMTTTNRKSQQLGIFINLLKFSKSVKYSNDLALLVQALFVILQYIHIYYRLYTKTLYFMDDLRDFQG